MKKTMLRSGKAKVTFELPPAVEAREVAVCGEFNGWGIEPTPLARRKDGRFSTTVTLPPGRYRFRYLLDGERWENDWTADGYVANDYGSDDSVVTV
ncbi:MAG: isoamylase early set domain-containing protein [Acidimicrobiales bacterium]